MGDLLAQFEGKKYLNMETYRKSGEPVRTPVWFVQENDVLYVRTAISTGKFKRVRNNPAVKIAPCDFKGNVKGDWISAEAKEAPTPEADAAYRLLRKKYGMTYALTTAFMRGKTYVVLKIRGMDK